MRRAGLRRRPTHGRRGQLEQRPPIHLRQRVLHAAIREQPGQAVGHAQLRPGGGRHVAAEPLLRQVVAHHIRRQHDVVRALRLLFGHTTSSVQCRASPFSATCHTPLTWGVHRQQHTLLYSRLRSSNRARPQCGSAWVRPGTATMSSFGSGSFTPVYVA
jgi:hypothetical protein